MIIEPVSPSSGRIPSGNVLSHESSVTSISIWYFGKVNSVLFLKVQLPLLELTNIGGTLRAARTIGYDKSPKEGSSIKTAYRNGTTVRRYDATILS
jgi:hypothetical protein